MATAAAKLTFLLSERTVPWLGRESGIPWDVIRSVSAGTGTFTTRQARQFRNLYQRESYSRLREAGMSSGQARRFSSYGPESVMERKEKVTAVIVKLAESRTAQVAKRYEDEGILYDTEDIFADEWQSIWEGMRKSREEYETWVKYLDK